MMFKQIMTECVGECPKCHSTNVEWVNSGLEDMSYFYRGQCEDCNTTFTEWYKVEYEITEWWVNEDEDKRSD